MDKIRSLIALYLSLIVMWIVPKAARMHFFMGVARATAMYHPEAVVAGIDKAKKRHAVKMSKSANAGRDLNWHYDY